MWKNISQTGTVNSSNEGKIVDTSVTTREYLLANLGVLKKIKAKFIN